MKIDDLIRMVNMYWCTVAILPLLTWRSSALMSTVITTHRGYAERQKMMAVVVEGQFVEFYLTPQTVGGGEFLFVTVCFSPRS